MLTGKEEGNHQKVTRLPHQLSVKLEAHDLARSDYILDPSRISLGLLGTAYACLGMLLHDMHRLQQSITREL